jgi:hypothetical protein
VSCDAEQDRDQVVESEIEAVSTVRGVAESIAPPSGDPQARTSSERASAPRRRARTLMDERRRAITMEEGQELRQQAIVRLKKKSDFKAHLLAYVLVNTFLVVIWAATGAGFPWPVFFIFGWGIGVAFNAWDVYARVTPTESEITREMDALRHSGV